MDERSLIDVSFLLDVRLLLDVYLLMVLGFLIAERFLMDVCFTLIVAIMMVVDFLMYGCRRCLPFLLSPTEFRVPIFRCRCWWSSRLCELCGEACYSCGSVL
ncbi:unnamed protein product [Prorocentrum cordatum]|uniref:Uncharacterized protein n=1 Tax=Prorocentrum cordatum TaxID=2364126 RepID=A0ABN9SYQ7_9DINO|nr:unnamed protein product [Polarella glacialis]